MNCLKIFQKTTFLCGLVAKTIILTRFEQIIGDYIKTFLSLVGFFSHLSLNVVTHLCFNLYDIMSFFRVGRELNIFIGAPANKSC